MALLTHLSKFTYLLCKITYACLFCAFRTIAKRNDFSDQFRKIILRYEIIVYNVNVMRQIACWGLS